MQTSEKISIFLFLSAFIKCSHAHGATIPNGTQSCLDGSCLRETDSNSLLQGKVQISDLSINQPSDIQGSDPQLIVLGGSSWAVMPGAFHYWVDDGCQTESDDSPDDVVGYFEDPNAPVAAARCCNTEGTSCSTPEMCPRLLTYAQASSKCTQDGKRLCTKDELLSNMCCGKGGNCDSYKVWTGTTAPAPCETESKYSGRRRSSAPFTECPVGTTEGSFNAESGCCRPCSSATTQEQCNLATCYTHTWLSSFCLPPVSMW